jgi:hypothetical protein
VQYILIRDVKRTECPWLDRDMRAGERVYAYFGATYGCIGPYGIAVTFKKNTKPFFELPSKALIKN